MKDENTTIKISKKTKLRLDRLKYHKRQSYNEAIEYILEILNTCRINPIKAREKLLEIDKISHSFNEKSKPSA